MVKKKGTDVHNFATSNSTTLNIPFCSIMFNNVRMVPGLVIVSPPFLGNVLHFVDLGDNAFKGGWWYSGCVNFGKTEGYHVFIDDFVDIPEVSEWFECCTAAIS